MAKKQHEPEHIIVQLRKVVNTHGHSNVRFSKETSTTVTIDEAQQVMSLYSDARPQDKELIQRYVSESHERLREVARGDWFPHIEVERVREHELFNTDEIFGMQQEPAKKFRPIIRRQKRT